MKSNKRLSTKIWLFLAIFSILILLLLWLIQILFFDKYYEYNKSKELKKASYVILENYHSNNFMSVIDKLSYDNGICINIESTNRNSFYKAINFNRGCLIEGDKEYNYKKNFIDSDENLKSYKIINKRFNNKTLIYGIKLDNYTYAFISASLVPLDAATILLKQQLIIISIIILILSIIIAYFISKIISKPIVKISSKAKLLSKGNFDIDFIENSDIKEINELENTLNQMKNEFIKTDNLRKDLMANVSHDLKTPLTMIKAYAEMNRDIKSLNIKKKEQNLNIIIEETERLNLLVNDILTLSNIESEIEKLNIEEIDLDKLICNIIAKYDILVSSEKYKFIYHGKGTIVKADKKRLEQVLYNLINNAINHTGDDKKIYIDIKEFDEKYRIEIKDTGLGISNDEINLIWDRYYHTNKNYKRNTIGTGLGLSIVKNILEKHNFNYGVTSTKKGTIFYFEIKR